MASKVNTKFVVMLVGALLALAIGVGALAAYSLRMSGERNIAAGDQLMVEAEEARVRGDREAELELVGEAAGQYGRAVHKDRSRRDWLVKLRDTLLLTIPETEVEYEKKYTQTYLGVLDQIASLDPTNGYSQYAFIKAREEVVRAGGGPNALLQFESDIDRRVQSLDQDSPMAIRLNALRGLARTDRTELENVDKEKREEARAWMQRFYDEFLADPELFTVTPVDDVSPDEFAKAAREDHKRIALGLIQAEINEHSIAQTAGRAQDARQHLTTASTTGAAILTENADYRNDARFMEIVHRIPLLMVVADQPNPVRQREAKDQILATAKEQIFSALAATDADDLPLLSIVRFALWYDDDESRARLADEVGRLLDQDIRSPQRLFVAGRLLARLDRQNDALEVFDRIRTMPAPPLSLDGVLLPGARIRAMTQQASIYLDLRQEALAEGNAAEAKEHLDAAVAARDRLAANSGSATRPNLLLTDANIAIARNQTKQAIRLLEEYRKDFDESAEVLALLAGQLLVDRNLGEAKRLLEQLVGSGLATPDGALMLARMYADGGQIEQAVEMLRNQTRSSATPEAFTDQIAEYQELIDIRAGNETSDPVRAAAVRAEELLARRDIEGATRILDRLVARRPDAASDERVEFLRAQVEEFSGNSEAAIARLERALESNPDSQLLQRLLTALTTQNPVEVSLAEIDASDASDEQKALRKYDLLRSAGRSDEADAELDRLERLDPAHPTVLNVRFAEAISTGDFDAASRIVARVEEANADGVDGLLYQGRLQAARGELAAAVRTLRTAIDLVPSSIEIRRYLGVVLVQAGQIDEGLDYLRLAHEAREDNLTILSEYIQLLRQVGRVSEARAALDPENDPGAPARQVRLFTNIWLDLEAQVGNTSKALQERRTYFKADLMSGNLEADDAAQANAIRLVELLIGDEQVDEAQQVIDQARSVMSEGQIALAEAGIAVGRARKMDDAEKSQQAIEAAVAGLRQSAENEAASTSSPDALLAAAQFSFRAGNFEQGIEILRSAVPYESDASREVSRQLATTLAQRALQLDGESQRLEAEAQQLEGSDPRGAEALRERAAQETGRAESSREEAAEVYAQMRASGMEDANNSIALSLAELLLLTDQLDRASEIVSQVRDASPNSLNATLLAAQIASRKGDRTEATRLFNQAVERHPTNFLAFFERARYHADDSSRRADVLADLRRVNELRPSLLDGWVLRYRVMMQSGDANAAFTVLRDGINAAPSIADGLSRLLVQDLIRMGRAAEAQSVAIERANGNPGDAYWQSVAGQIASQRGSMNEAVRFFTRLVESPEIVADPAQHGQAAAQLLDAKLRAGQGVSASEVRSLLPLIEALGFEGANGVSRSMLLARAFAAIPAERNRAGTYIQQAYTEALRESADATPSQKLRVWFANLPLIVGGQTQAYEYVAGLEQSIRRQMEQNPDADITNPLYLRVLTLEAGQIRGESPSDLIERAEALLEESENDPVARFQINRLLSRYHSYAKNYEAAAQHGKDALAINANDLELLNNVAFFLAKYLNRPTEALPFADRAAQLGPENPDVLDTVGVVYMLNGEAGRAIPLLERALQFANSQEQRVPASVHLAEALVKQGDLGAARGYIEDAERLLPIVSEGVRSAYAPEVERVKGLLESR